MSLDLQQFRNPELARDLIEAIDRWAPESASLMEVCGTHTVAIARSGFRSIMPSGTHLVSGPGCPVCVTANQDIDKVIALARTPHVIITTFGDMVRVPGSSSSLLEEKAAGADVRIVYSPLDALKIAIENSQHDIVFVGVGFETTTPLVAAAIKRARDQGLRNFSVISIHKNVPHALKVLIDDPEVKIDALILPGHVSTIIGSHPYDFLARDYGIPGVVTGFEPVDILQGIAMIMRQLHEGRAEIEIAYARGVMNTGNQIAQALINEVFEECDAVWRGLGLIPASGFSIRKKFADFDALHLFDIEAEETIEPIGCRCGDVLRGVIPPNSCKLFGTACVPEHPIGPCMVSSEGSCAAYYRYQI
jgi:hydrogenase expression/formation protein HypD